MDRRGFLSLLSRAVVGATVAYSFPSVIVPRNIQPAYPAMPSGLAYLLNDSSRILHGLSTVSFPDLNAPSVDLSGAVLSPRLFEAMRKHLSAMTWRTNENQRVYQMSVLQGVNYG
jgi:hypothetical protein